LSGDEASSRHEALSLERPVLDRVPLVDRLVDLLADDAVLVVFVVMGIGSGIGAIRVKGVALGPAAALFVGLAVGAANESLSATEGLDVLRELGLVLFTYALGLAFGPTFLASMRRDGTKAVALTAGLIVVLAGLCALMAEFLDLSPADRAGLFAGSTTNTPSLQAASEAVSAGDPVVAYSVAYPAAVASMLVVTTLLLGRHLPLPAKLEPPPGPAHHEPIVAWTVHVLDNDESSLDELRARFPGITFSRIEHDGQVSVATNDRRLSPGDRVVVLGPELAVAACCRRLGERSDRHLALDRTAIDFRRVVVSNRRLAGQRLGDLDLPGRFGGAVTRVRVGD
jgi:putative transport protein